jgi:integrase
MLNGKSHNMGLGSVNDLTLAEARAHAQRYRAAKLPVNGAADPMQQRNALVAAKRAEAAAIIAAAIVAPTFAEVAEAFVTNKERGWRDRSEGSKWRSMLKTHAAPLMALPVDTITTKDILALLEPMWSTRYRLAKTLQYRIESVLQAATARGDRQGPNPAAWKGLLDNWLEASDEAKAVQHRDALPWQEVPAFIAGLRKQGGVKAAAIEFTILTAARAGEVVENARKAGATWGEFDLASATWTIPASRMKGKLDHRVPLSSRAVEILREMQPGDPLARVFPIGYDSLKKAMPAGVTLHGFRSSFRDWASLNAVRDDVAERCLAHAEGDRTVAAYKRDDLFSLRRPVMQSWSEFCSGQLAEQKAA